MIVLRSPSDWPAAHEAAQWKRLRDAVRRAAGTGFRASHVLVDRRAVVITPAAADRWRRELQQRAWEYGFEVIS